MIDRIINSINTVQDHIIESEMEGEIDKTDSWYPIFEALEELKDKRFNELGLDKWFVFLYTWDSTLVVYTNKEIRPSYYKKKGKRLCLI